MRPCSWRIWGHRKSPLFCWVLAWIKSFRTWQRCAYKQEIRKPHTEVRKKTKQNASASFVWNACLTIHKSRCSLSQYRIWMRKRINGVFSKGHHWLKWQGRERRRKTLWNVKSITLQPDGLTYFPMRPRKEITSFQSFTTHCFPLRI